MHATLQRKATYIAIAILSSLHAIHQEDNRTPPGFASIAHHRPHQLFARLVRQSVNAKLYRLQLLAHAYQQPANDVQVHHQQPACTSSKPAYILAVNIKCCICIGSVYKMKHFH